jgi:hypothetical protein
LEPSKQSPFMTPEYMVAMLQDATHVLVPFSMFRDMCCPTVADRSRDKWLSIERVFYAFHVTDCKSRGRSALDAGTWREGMEARGIVVIGLRALREGERLCMRWWPGCSFDNGRRSNMPWWLTCFDTLLQWGVRAKGTWSAPEARGGVMTKQTHEQMGLWRWIVLHERAVHTMYSASRTWHMLLDTVHPISVSIEPVEEDALSSHLVLDRLWVCIYLAQGVWVPDARGVWDAIRASSEGARVLRSILADASTWFHIVHPHATEDWEAVGVQHPTRSDMKAGKGNVEWGSMPWRVRVGSFTPWDAPWRSLPQASQRALTSRVWTHADWRSGWYAEAWPYVDESTGQHILLQRYAQLLQNKHHAAAASNESLVPTHASTGELASRGKMRVDAAVGPETASNGPGMNRSLLLQAKWRRAQAEAKRTATEPDGVPPYVALQARMSVSVEQERELFRDAAIMERTDPKADAFNEVLDQYTDMSIMPKPEELGMWIQSNKDAFIIQVVDKLKDLGVSMSADWIASCVDSQQSKIEKHAMAKAMEKTVEWYTRNVLHHMQKKKTTK